MNKFKRIVAVDETRLHQQAIVALQEWSDEVVIYHDFPTEEEEVIRRIGNADAVLVSFRTHVLHPLFS